jgi:hypothetical protein
VGIRRRAWILGLEGSIRWSVGIKKAAVLPVPFLARARMSRPVKAIGIASSWIGEGESNPASKMPIRRLRWRNMFSHSRPFVARTSYERKRERWAFSKVDDKERRLEEKAPYICLGTIIFWRGAKAGFPVGVVATEECLSTLIWDVGLEEIDLEDD